MSDDTKNPFIDVTPEATPEAAPAMDNVLPFTQETPLLGDEDVSKLAAENFAKSQREQERPTPVSDGTHYIIRMQNTQSYNATAAYLYWSIVFFKNIPQTEIFMLSMDSVDETTHPEGSHFYTVGETNAPDITDSKGEYIYFSHPFEVWDRMIAPVSNYPYCEVMEKLYGKLDGEGMDKDYRKNYLEGQALFDTTPTNMMYWGKLFEEEKYFIPEEEEVVIDEPTRKFDKFKSKASKKKQAEAKAKKKDRAGKPMRYFRQEVHNSGLILNTKLEAYERYLAFNTSFEIMLPVPLEDGTFKGFNFISLNSPECRLTTLDPVFDQSVHDGCLYYQQIHLQLYKVTLFTKAIPSELGTRLCAYLNHIAEAPDALQDIHKVVNTRALKDDLVTVSASIFVSKAVWDKQTEPTLLDQLNTAFSNKITH